MSKVAARRDLQEAPCMISSAQYPIGTWLYIYGKNTGALRWCKVVDVSGPEHKAGHIRRRRLVELSYEVTRDLCGALNEPSRACPVLIIQLEE